LRLRGLTRRRHTGADALVHPHDVRLETKMNMQMANTRKDILLIIVWGLAGYLSWYISLIMFTFFTHSFVTIPTKFAARLGIMSLTSIVNLLSCHLPDYVFAIAFVALLTRWCGYTRSALLSFIFGAVITTLFISINGLFDYLNIYSKLPSWAISWFTSNMVHIFIFLPISSWAGTLIGCRWKQQSAN
jgi:hypothetical protein